MLPVPGGRSEVITLTAVALLLAGCAASQPSSTTSTAAPTRPAIASAASSTTPSANASPPPVLPSGIPTPGPAPSTTAGLTQASLPDPQSLGQAWHYRVDPGSPEAGYEGNGQPAQARDPAEVAAGIAPLGCQPAATAPPLARAALEVDYGRSRPTADGVGLLLVFADPAQAQQFFASYTRVLRACATHPSPGAPRITLVPQGSSTVFGSIRVDPASDPDFPVWTEAVRLSGRTVRLLTVSTANPAIGTPFQAR